MRGPVQRIMVATLLGAPVVMCVHNLLGGKYLYAWYLVFAEPGMAIFSAEAVRRVAMRVARKPSARPWAIAVAAMLYMVWFGSITNPQRITLREHPIEPLWESVLAMRGEHIDPRSAHYDDVLTAQFHMHTQGYDPGARKVESRDELLALAAEADAADRPLFVNFAQWGLAAAVFPDIIATLTDPSYFERVGIYPGLEQHCTRYVFGYLAGSLADSAP